MLVVSDSSIFISFAQIGNFSAIEKFGKEYGLTVPYSVFQEVWDKGRHKPGSEEIYKGKTDGWLKVMNITDINFYNSLNHYGIHIGEQEALTLAHELSAEMILLDDNAAIRVWKHILQPKGVKTLDRYYFCQLLYDLGFSEMERIKFSMLDNSLK